MIEFEIDNKLSEEQKEALNLLFSSLNKIRSMARSTDLINEIYNLSDAIHNLPLVVGEPSKLSRNRNELAISKQALSAALNK